MSSMNIERAPWPQPQRCAHPLQVVVVDDDPNLRETICELLRLSDEFEISGTGANGIEAICIAEACRPDILIMDVNMPYLDGVAAAKVIAQVSPSTALILTSADDSPELRDRYRCSGAHAFVPKFVLCRNIRQHLAAVKWQADGDPC